MGESTLRRLLIFGARSTNKKTRGNVPRIRSAPPNRRGTRRISASFSSNGGDRLSGRLAAHADDRSWGNKPCGRPVVHPSDTLFGRLSAHPSGKPCDDTRTG